MKLLFLGALLLAGCAIISPPKFDSGEYKNYIEIAAYAEEIQCQPEENKHLLSLTNRAVLYSSFLPNNELMAKGATEMNKTAKTLDKVEPSSAACKIRLLTIHLMSANLAEAAGGKPR